MRTLGKKISALVLVTLLVGTLLSWLLVSGDLKTRLNEEVSDQLSTDTRAVVQLLQEKGVASLSSSLESWSRILGVRITLIDGDGSVLADSTISPDQLSQVDNHLTRPEIHQALEAGSGRDLRYSESTRERYLYYAVRTMIGDRPIVVRCSLLYSQFDQILWRVRRHLVLSLCIAGFFSMVLGSLWARRLTHPLEKLTLAAGALERGERAAFPDSGGTEIERLSLSMKNMAERLEATVADLQEEREQLRTVVEAMPVGLLLLDSAGRVRYANGVLHALLRDLPERLEGESIQGAIRIPELIDLFAAVQRRQREKCSFPFRQGGSQFFFGAEAIRTGNQVLMIVQDVTEQHQLESARRSFFADAGHEFQTPLTVIAAAAELLAQMTDSNGAERDVYLDQILHQQKRMTHLVDDLLLLSRLDADLPIEEDADFDLAANVRFLVKESRENPRARNIDWEVCVPECLPYRGKENELRRAISNILDNAVKYTAKHYEGAPGGKIKVQLSENTAAYSLKISDNGVGIPHQAMEHIFERFMRVDKGRGRDSKDAGGYGLGLAIARRIVLAHKGDIEVRSGNGTTEFTLILPR